ncbi:MAG: hypothetical protein ACREOO_24220 [bacterium]
MLLIDDHSPGAIAAKPQQFRLGGFATAGQAHAFWNMTHQELALNGISYAEDCVTNSR